MDIKKEIIDWFYGPQDYSSGLLLLQEVTKKNKVLGKLIKRGDSKSAMEKMKWELNKIAGLNIIPAPTAAAVKVTKEKAVKPADVPKTEFTDEFKKEARLSLIGDKPIDNYPDIIKRLVNEYSKFYIERGVAHKELVLLADSNEASVVESRQGIILKIKELSDRMEILNEVFEEFEKEGTVPDENDLWPEEKEVKPFIKAFSVEELKTLKKNIQSSITKDRNLLLYQAKTKGKKENPMPAGPKRTTLEKRIIKKDAEILSIDQQIADMG